MNTVYVRWYGNVVQGELLDGETMGMKHVRIPLDGHHPVALFTPQHIYDSPEQVSEKSSINVAKSVEISQNPPKIATEQPKVPTEIATKDILPADDRQMIEAFKQANWDHERNHLRIDKLDDFYHLWRMVMTPFGFVEPVPQSETPQQAILPALPPEPPKRIVSDAKMEEIKQELKKSLEPKKTVKVVQLSLFI